MQDTSDDLTGQKTSKSIWEGWKAPVPLGLVLLILVCTITELYLQGCDHGLWGSHRMRYIAYDYGGFLPGLLDQWRPNYAAQPYVMFVSYAFLHSGIIHLLFNMITLWSLGLVVYDRVGARGFWILYLLSTLGGAIFFGLLAPNTQTMVGASGALFGLAGGILAWNYVDRFTEHERLWPILQAVFLLLLMNLVLWWAMDGQLAWQTHLGGFLAGWAGAMLIDPTSKPILSSDDENEGRDSD